MISSKLPNIYIGHLLAGLFFVCFYQVRFQVLTQEIATRKLRNDTQHATTANHLNGNYPLVRHQHPRADARPIPTGIVSQQRNLRVQDKSPVGSRGEFQNLSRRMQDGGDQLDSRIPFWNIAHMINSIGEIEPALK